MHLPILKLDNGLYIDGTRIDTVRTFKVDSKVDNFSEVTVSFLCQIDGLDNISHSLYEFKKMNNKEYKPHRKYKSR